MDGEAVYLENYQLLRSKLMAPALCLCLPNTKGYISQDCRFNVSRHENNRNDIPCLELNISVICARGLYFVALLKIRMPLLVYFSSSLSKYKILVRNTANFTLCSVTVRVT
jgi:hypothetical protein